MNAEGATAILDDLNKIFASRKKNIGCIVKHTFQNNYASLTFNCCPTSLSIFLSLCVLLSVRFHQLALDSSGLLLSDYTTPHRPSLALLSFCVYHLLLSVLCPHGGQSLCPFISVSHLLFSSFLPAPTTLSKGW